MAYSIAGFLPLFGRYFEQYWNLGLNVFWLGSWPCFRWQIKSG